jgi:hypothetical protein
MMNGRTNVGARRTGAGAVVLALIAMLASSGAAQGVEPGNSAATITASFGDSCTDFEAHSSKDISHVEIHYADGRVVKHESIDSPDYSVDGGDELDFAIVKSGTTADRFDCDRSPVTACSDGVDNDGNGLADYPDDPGCASTMDDEELSDNGDGFD